MKRNSEYYEYEEITFLVLLGLSMAIIMPVIIGGFFMKGFEESFVAGKPLEFGTILLNFLIYLFFLLIDLIGLPVLKIREMNNVKLGEDVARQKTPKLMAVAIIHDPSQDGALWNLFKGLGFKDEKNPMRFSLSMTRMFVLSILIFATLGLFITFTSVPQLTFQVTPTMEVFFSAEPASFAETIMMIFILSIFLGFDAFIVSKFKLPPVVFWIIALLIICPIIGGGGWASIHKIVYGNSEINLFRTFIFGWLGSTLTVLFGTFIIWYVWHFTNNFFAKIYQLGNTEDTLFIAGACLLILLVIWITAELYIARYKKKKKRYE